MGRRITNAHRENDNCYYPPDPCHCSTVTPTFSSHAQLQRSMIAAEPLPAWWTIASVTPRAALGG
jgi:hypothetical protein